MSLDQTQPNGIDAAPPDWQGRQYVTWPHTRQALASWRRLSEGNPERLAELDRAEACFAVEEQPTVTSVAKLNDPTLKSIAVSAMSGAFGHRERPVPARSAEASAIAATRLLLGRLTRNAK